MKCLNFFRSSTVRSNVSRSRFSRQLGGERLERRDLLASDLGFDALYAPISAIDVSAVQIAVPAANVVVGEGEKVALDAAVVAGGYDCVSKDALLDANYDDHITALDVLIRVTKLNGGEDNGVAGARPVNPLRDRFWYDTDGDNWIKPKDVLNTVNWINSHEWTSEVDNSCDGVRVTFTNGGYPGALAQYGEDSVLASAMARTDTTAFLNGLEFRGPFENIVNVHLTVDVNRDNYPDYEFDNPDIWAGEDGMSFVNFQFWNTENTIADTGHVLYELHGTPVGEVGSVGTFELTWAGVDTWPGRWAYAEIEDVSTEVTTVNMEVDVIDFPGTFIAGENAYLGSLVYEFQGAAGLLAVDDVYVQVRAEFPDGTDAMWNEDVFTEVWLNGASQGSQGMLWSGWTGGSNAEYQFRFEDMSLGTGVSYQFQAKTTAAIPDGTRFQLSVTEADWWPNQSYDAVGEWHDAVFAPKAIFIWEGDNQFSVEAAGDALLVHGVSVVPDGPSPDWVELWWDSNPTMPGYETLADRIGMRLLKYNFDILATTTAGIRLVNGESADFEVRSSNATDFVFSDDTSDFGVELYYDGSDLPADQIILR